MSYDCETESGLIIPLRYFLAMINKQTVEKFDYSMAGIQRELQDILEEDEEEFAANNYSESRDAYDLMANRVIQSFYDKYVEQTTSKDHYVEEIRISFAHCMERLFPGEGELSLFWHHSSAVISLFDLVFQNAFGTKNIPTLKDLRIFDSVRDHGDHFSMGGLFREVLIHGDLSAEEIQKEIYKKPCLIFEEDECFRVVPSAKGRRFRDALGIKTLEKSTWVEQSY